MALARRLTKPVSQLHNRGTAIITALLFVTIAISLTVLIYYEQLLTIQRNQVLFDQDKLHSAHSLAVAQASAQIMTTLNNQDEQSRYIGLDQAWSNPIQGKIDDIHMFAQVYDAQSFFDVNNLFHDDKPQKEKAKEFSQPWLQSFSRLLTVVNKNIADEFAMTVSEGVQEWISPRNEMQTPDRRYGRTLPYLPAYLPMVSRTELQLVADIDSALYRDISPYLFAVPRPYENTQGLSKKTKININTADKAVLSAVLALDINTVDQIIQQRPLLTAAKLKEVVTIVMNQSQVVNEKNLAEKLEQLSIDSQWFIVETQLSSTDSQGKIFSLLAVEDGSIEKIWTMRERY